MFYLAKKFKPILANVYAIEYNFIAVWPKIEQMIMPSGHTAQNPRLQGVVTKV